MLVIGLLLVLAAVALIAGAVYDGAEPVTMEAFGAELDTTVAGVFFTGVATTLVLFTGLWLLKSATARSRKQRANRKQQKVRHRESVARLEQERNELRAENARLAKQASRPGPGRGPAADGTPASGTPTSTGTPASGTPAGTGTPTSTGTPASGTPAGTGTPAATGTPTSTGTPPPAGREQVDLTPTDPAPGGRHAESRHRG